MLAGPGARDFGLTAPHGATCAKTSRPIRQLCGQLNPGVGRKPIPLTCPICGIHADAKVVTMMVTPGSDFVQLPNFEMQVYNFLVRCTRCESGH